MLGDRYLLCSDGLSDVVSAETLHHTLSTLPDLNDVTVQLIELAIRGGGPDNITVIVADVVDTDRTAAAPTTAPVMAGAASHGSTGDLSLLQRADSPAGRAQMLAHTAPQPAVMLDEPRAAPGGWPDAEPGRQPEGQPQTRNGHRAQRQRRSSRHRWPIVTIALGVLAAVIIGGGYGAWYYAEHQYYIGTDANQVTIFRGINQRVAGVNLFSVYARTGITEQQVPPQELQMIQGTISATSLDDAQRIVGQLHTQDTQCKQAYTARNSWIQQQVALTAYNKAHPKARKPALPPEPTVPADCPAATALGVTPVPSTSPLPSRAGSASHSAPAHPATASSR
jgi:protein phosphatase